MGWIVVIGIGVALVGAFLINPAVRDRFRARARRRNPNSLDKDVDRRIDFVRFTCTLVGIAIAAGGAVLQASGKSALKDKVASGERALLELERTTEARVATERAAREELERKMAGMKDKVIPRSLPAATVTALRAAVQELGSPPTFSVWTLMGDTEAQAYANELGNALVQAGCSVDGGGMDTGISPTFRGIAIGIARGLDRPPAGAQALAEILRRAGIPVVFGPKDNVQGDGFQLVVGGKPLP